MPNTFNAGREDEELLARIEGVLDRTAEISALSEFLSSLRRVGQAEPNLPTSSSIAFVFDSSAILRLNRGKNSSDTLDYLAGAHTIPVVLPGQVIQEFWNNQLAVVTTNAQKVSRDIASLVASVDALDPGFGMLLEDLQRAAAGFRSEFSDIYDESTVQDTVRMVSVFEQNGMVVYVPRDRFHRFAAQRNSTKTPPGFKDPGDGDFFVWVDALFALTILTRKHQIDGVVFVTEDTKPDWQRSGVPHPVLAAEMRALVDASLEFWTVKRLHEYIQGRVGAIGTGKRIEP